MDANTILKTTQDAMLKAQDHLKRELKGFRTGRAAPSILEMVRVEAYGSQSELKSLASITAPEPTQLLVKPFDATIVGEIKKAIEAAGLGLNPMAEGKQLRINIPPLSGDRRKQMSALCKKLAEETKVSFRNARRDGNKLIDQVKAAGHVAEDEIENLKTEVQDLLKKYETETDTLVTAKQKEIETV
ncbi:ribosome recycling factor [soil metagenome]